MKRRDGWYKVRDEWREARSTSIQDWLNAIRGAMLSALVLWYHLDSAHFANPTQAYISTIFSSCSLLLFIHPYEAVFPGTQPHGQFEKKQHPILPDFKGILVWPVWLNEEGKIPPTFFHTLSLLSFSAAPPSLTKQPKPFQALPDRRTQPHVGHLTLTRHPSLSPASANPSSHPPIGFHGKLPSFVVPEAAS